MYTDFQYPKFEEVEYDPKSNPSNYEFILTRVLYDGRELTAEEMEQIMEDEDLNYDLYYNKRTSF